MVFYPGNGQEAGDATVPCHAMQTLGWTIGHRARGPAWAARGVVILLLEGRLLHSLGFWVICEFFLGGISKPLVDDEAQISRCLESFAGPIRRLRAMPTIL